MLRTQLSTENSGCPEVAMHYHNQPISHGSSNPIETDHFLSNEQSGPSRYDGVVDNGAPASDGQAQAGKFVAFDEESHAIAPSQTFAAHRRRMRTNLDEAPIEVRHTHDYFLRRPRPLMVEHQGHLIDLGEHGKLDVEHPEQSYHLNKKLVHKEEHHPNSLNKQRERMDLFVDLIWVGIISNISEHFFDRLFAQENEIGAAVGEFVLLFIPAFRIWICLQQWLNSYYMDDYFQRAFVVWIMILGLIWGNNAPYMLDDLSKDNNFTIIAYIVALTSFSVAQVIYSHWLPWLRKPLLLGFLLGLPETALWIALTIVSDGYQKSLLLTSALIYNTIEIVFFASPISDRLLGSEIRKASDNRTMLRRYENFFVIAIGEGVFLLIRQSPLGSGFTISLGRGIQSLVIYYFLNWMYFHGDVSKRFIHPIDRRWWIRLLYQWLHVPLFGALVVLSSGTLFLVQYEASGFTDNSALSAGQGETFLGRAKYSRRTEEPSDGEESAIKFDTYTFRAATATTCVAVAVILFTQFLMAIMCRSVDEPRSLLVTRPLIRMIPRLGASILLATIWLVNFTDATTVLGVVLAIITFVMASEEIMGMPRHARLFEPKNASLMPVRT